MRGVDPRRPTFEATVTALSRTEEERDVAEVLRDVEAKHQGGDRPDVSDLATWGKCSSCRTPWPCDIWTEAEELAVLYLGRAQDRVWAHAKEVMRR